MRLDGTVGDSYDNAMAESADSIYETEFVWRGVRQSYYMGEHQPVLHVAEVKYGN